MKERKRIHVEPEIVLRRRPLTLLLDHPWPFPLSVVDGRILKNVAAPAAPIPSKRAKNSRKMARRVRIVINN